MPGKQELEIRPQTPQEKERLKTDEDVPKYRIKLDLDEEQVDRLTRDFFKEFEALDEEREPLEEKWKHLQRQYDGEVQMNTRMLFNLHTHQSRIKVDAITRACNQAFNDVDPKFAVTPRPEETRKDGVKLAETQGDFLDFAMDEEIQPNSEYTRIFRQSVMKYVGIQKLSYEFVREKRKREEQYKGEIKFLGQKPNGEPILDNEGLKNFVSQYPEALDKYPGLVKKLLAGKDINIVVEYMETIENNPNIKSVNVEDFWVRNSADSNKKLRNTHCIVEREMYTYWEALKKEQNEEWDNVEDLFVEQSEDDQGEIKLIQFGDKETREYEVLEGTYYWKLKEGDDEEVKMKCWFGRANKVFLGAILYPYYGIDCEYKGYWMSDNNKGFYGDAQSVMWLLKDSNIAQNAILNLMLHGTYSRNILTPIVKAGSPLEAQVLDKKWKEGLPLTVDEGVEDVRKEYGFLDYPAQETDKMIALVQMLKQSDSDISLVQEGLSGKESPVDPDAPAKKTIALLNAAGVNVQDYIKNMLPSFNETGSDLLQLYYQMSHDSRKFRIRGKSKKVTGEDAFGNIARADMVAKTNIESRAMAFSFDKVNEKRENLAMVQMLLNHPVALQRPELLYISLLMVMKSWSPMWKNLTDVALPSPEEFAQEQVQVAVQAVAQLAQAVQQQEQTTGVKPDIDLSTIVGAVNKAQQEATVGSQEQK